MEMATPGELVETVAEALDIEAATVTQYDRVLAEAGLRSKGGRGTSAAKVTARDGANLLIAIMGAPLAGAAVKDAARTCRAYGSLRLLPRPSDPKAFGPFGLLRLRSLPPDHTLIDAIEALIQGSSEGENFKIPIPGQRPYTGADLPFDIRLVSPRPWASIECHNVDELDSPHFRDARLFYFNDSPSRPRADYMHQTRQISFAPIRKLGQLLALKSKTRKSSDRRRR